MKYFVYFSLSGNGDYIADLLKEKGYEPIEVEMVNTPKKVGFFTILKYGGRAMTNKKEEISDLPLFIKEEDEVVIGSPIWNDRLSTPINTILDKIVFNKETTKFILYPAGKGTKKSFKQLEKLGFKNQPTVISNPLENKEKVSDLLKEF
jgi:multimeric flavodoxin WrbA